MISVGATDISYGRPFAFTQEYFDLICSDLEALPISRAVAASNGFPGLFSPITLSNHRANCGDREPAWLAGIPDAVRRDPLSRLGEDARALAPYLDPSQTKYVHLADGGITDNLGLRVAGTSMQALSGSAATVRARGYDRLRRILLISVDGQGTQDSTIARTRLVGGIFSLIGLVSGAQIDRYNFETMTTVTQQLQVVQQSLIASRCAQGKIVHGTPCDDVQAALVHISLASMPPGPERDRLLAIPTGLSIDKPDVDALVVAGEKAVHESAPLRLYLDQMDAPPPVPQVAMRRR
jgi:NTE family protein